MLQQSLVKVQHRWLVCLWYVANLRTDTLKEYNPKRTSATATKREVSAQLSTVAKSMAFGSSPT